MRSTVAVALLAVAVVLPLRAQEKTPMRGRGEAGAVSRALAGRPGPQNVNWIEGGRRFSFVVRGDSGEQIRALDPATGGDSLIFTGRGLTFPGSAEAFAYRAFTWARASPPAVPDALPAAVPQLGNGRLLRLCHRGPLARAGRARRPHGRALPRRTDAGL